MFNSPVLFFLSARGISGAPPSFFSTFIYLNKVVVFETAEIIKTVANCRRPFALQHYKYSTHESSVSNIL
jgi:hypothetical protein